MRPSTPANGPMSYSVEFVTVVGNAIGMPGSGDGSRRTDISEVTRRNPAPPMYTIETFGESSWRTQIAGDSVVFRCLVRSTYEKVGKTILSGKPMFAPPNPALTVPPCGSPVASGTIPGEISFSISDGRANSSSTPHFV